MREPTQRIDSPVLFTAAPAIYPSRADINDDGANSRRSDLASVVSQSLCRANFFWKTQACLIMPLIMRYTAVGPCSVYPIESLARDTLGGATDTVISRWLRSRRNSGYNCSVSIFIVFIILLMYILYICIWKV